MSLKQKTLSGITWRFSGELLNYSITFIIGIILARLLSPREYGLIGMVTIFTVLTRPFINSGFSQALIRKKECTQADYSTVFYFNIFISLVFYAILFLFAPAISNFFNEPQLTNLVKVIGVVIIVDATALIQITILTRDVNFKLQTKVGFVSNVVSGLFGIILAYKGFGVWSLVYKTLVLHILQSSLYWYYSPWKPGKVFKIYVLKDMFGFSSKVLASGILDKVYFNLYNLVIAKYFSAQELGLFSRAKMFKDLVSNHFTEAIASVTFPVLATMQNDPARLRIHYRTILNSTMFMALSSMFALSAVSESLIITLIGEQWRDAVEYLQLLSFVGVFYPMQTSSRTLFYVFGKSGLALRLGIFSKALVVPVIFIGIKFGILPMILAMILSGLINYLIIGHYSGSLISYSIGDHLRDILPAFILAVVLGSSLFVIQKIISVSAPIMLIIQTMTGVLIFFGFSELLKIREYQFIVKTVKEKLFRKR